MPTQHKTEETIDRSRLQLLGVLAAAGASGACGPTPSKGGMNQKNYDSYQKAKKLSPDTEKPPKIGGEGESGGGSH